VALREHDVGVLRCGIQGIGGRCDQGALAQRQAHPRLGRGRARAGVGQEHVGGHERNERERLARYAPGQAQGAPAQVERPHHCDGHTAVRGRQLARQRPGLRGEPEVLAAHGPVDVDHRELLDRRRRHHGAAQGVELGLGAGGKVGGYHRLQRGDHLADAPLGARDRTLRGETHLLVGLAADIGGQAVIDRHDRDAGEQHSGQYRDKFSQARRDHGSSHWITVTNSRRGLNGRLRNPLEMRDRAAGPG
jgi:hypothetical protein